MTKADQLPIKFTQFCAGCYQLELPADFKQTKSYYADGIISVEMLDPEISHDGLYQGENRIKDWLASIEAKRNERVKQGAVAQYVLQDLKSEIKTLIIYSDDRSLYSNQNKEHAFFVYLFKDFPEHQLGIHIDGGGKLLYNRNNLNYQDKLRERINLIQKRANLIRYQPWPHTLSGVSFDQHFSTSYSKYAAEYEYITTFVNVERKKTSYIKFRSEISTLTEDQILSQANERINQLSLFANKIVKVAGREGKLIISDDRYSNTANQFIWVATDSKPNSIKYAPLEIEGKLDVASYPELKPMNSIDMIAGILKFIRVRENAFTEDFC